jgi:tetratricopeptide (TPR) repeat protein
MTQNLTPEQNKPIRVPGRAQLYLPLFIIIAACFAVYANAWPNVLVLDDKLFENPERFQALSNIPRYFAENAWATEGFSTNLYRPLLLTSITLDANVHGTWAAGYHLTNIGLHAVAVLLLYGLLRFLLISADFPVRIATLSALLGALIYAVHPMHTEAVNSIFNRSDILVAIFGLGGIWWLLENFEAHTVSAWAGFAIAYLLALLCKESAAILPALAVLLILASNDWGNLKSLRLWLPAMLLIIPLGLYGYLRATALSINPIGGANFEFALLDSTELGVRLALDDWPTVKQLVLASNTFYRAIEIVIWPFPVKLKYSKQAPLSDWVGLAVHALLIAWAIYQLRRKNYIYPTCLAFFYVSLIPATRIIGDTSLEPHVFARYLYLPSAGIAVILAFGLASLLKRYGVLVAAGIACVSLIVLAPATWSRNALWADETRLFQTEYEYGNHSTYLLRLLTSSYLEVADYRSVTDLCDKHSEALANSATLSIHCGIAYSRTGRDRDAIDAYTFATRSPSTRTVAHENLAKHYIRKSDRAKASMHLQLAIETETDPAMRAFRQGYLLVQLYPWNRTQLSRAREYFRRSLEIQPNLRVAREWLSRVEDRLNSDQQRN